MAERETVEQRHWRQAMAVMCPTCNAEPDVVCRRVGPPEWFHAERYKLGRQLHRAPRRPRSR